MGPVRLGVSVGVNVGHISEGFDITNHTAGFGGVYAVIPISNGWSFQTGAVLSMKGWERDESGTHDRDVAKLNYLELPTLIRFDFAMSGATGGFLYAGPAFDFKTGCTLGGTVHATGVTTSESCAEVARLSNGAFTFKSFDVGAVGGVGVRVAVGCAQLVATTQYESGFMDVTKSFKGKLRALSFGLGLEVPLPGR